MKQYPSIPAEIQLGSKVIGFSKIDGSNIRASWSNKKKFYKFGSRTRLLDPNEKPLGEAVELIKNKYEKILSDIFLKDRIQEVICFFEFWGPSSEFGIHKEEPHDITLIDVNYYKQGIMHPREFVKKFDKAGIAAVLYDGICNSMFVDLVRTSQLEGIGSEGVVCKKTDSRQSDMFKIKCNAWYERLRNHCNGDEKLFNSLI